MDNEMILFSDIYKIVCSELEVDVENVVIEYTDDLTRFGLDSLNVIKVVVALESKYEIEFPDEFLSINSMASIVNIHDILVEVLQNGNVY